MSLSIQNNSRALQFIDVAGLRALSGQKLLNGQSIDLLGDTSAGDGAGGDFYWDASSTASENAPLSVGTIVKLTDTTTGRFIRTDQTFITGIMFGQVGDGTTDARVPGQLAATFAGTIGVNVYMPPTAAGYFFDNGGTITLPDGVSFYGRNTKITLEDEANLGSFSFAFTLGDDSNDNHGFQFESQNGTTRFGNGDTDFDTAVNEAAWLTATSYVVNDLVTESNLVYICLVAHTSGTFATDLAANKWVLSTLQIPVANETTSFRGGFQGSGVANPNVYDCDFGAGIHNAVKFDTGANLNVRAHNLYFEGVVAQGLFISNTTIFQVGGLRSKNSHQSRFDHLLYLNENCIDGTIGEVIAENAGGVVVDIFSAGGETRNIGISKIITDRCRSAFSITGQGGFGCKDITAEIITAIEPFSVAAQVTQSSVCEGITIGHLNVRDAKNVAFRIKDAKHKNVRINDFLISGTISTSSIIIESSDGFHLGNGTFFDCFAGSSNGVVHSNNAAFKNFKMSNVTFRYENVVPGASPVFLGRGVRTGGAGITAVADSGGGVIEFTIVTHGLAVGDVFNVTNTTSYNGNQTVTAVGATNKVSSVDTFVATETGDWEGVGSGETSGNDCSAPISTARFFQENVNAAIYSHDNTHTNFLGVVHSTWVGRTDEGEGTPEGVIPGFIGDTFKRRDGSGNTAFYIKESGNGTTTLWVDQT